MSLFYMFRKYEWIGFTLKDIFDAFESKMSWIQLEWLSRHVSGGYLDILHIHIQVYPTYKNLNLQHHWFLMLNKKSQNNWKQKWKKTQKNTTKNVTSTLPLEKIYYQISQINKLVQYLLSLVDNFFHISSHLLFWVTWLI